MNKQTILGVIIILLAVAAGSYVLARPAATPAPEPVSEGAADQGKLKAANFDGTLTEVNTGCYADGECYVVVDGKHITTLRGWSHDIAGAADFDALSANIGKTVEVYAHDLGDGTYTLYGSEGFYVRLKN